MEEGDEGASHLKGEDSSTLVTFQEVEDGHDEGGDALELLQEAYHLRRIFIKFFALILKSIILSFLNNTKNTM